LNKVKLFYVHDPMCSWCYGFSPTYKKLVEQLPDNISLKRLVGGLAPDSVEPMPDTTRAMIQKNWHRIEQTIPGIKFNFAFWEKCQPRRSTYPACRAVIAARKQDKAFDVTMTQAIQQAYYINAQNPSDDDVLINCAKQAGLDILQFEKDYFSENVNLILHDEIRFCRSIGGNSFPSLILCNESRYLDITIDYNNHEVMLETIRISNR
jgi:putative protein-disulfide isomerase